MSDSQRAKTERSCTNCSKFNVCGRPPNIKYNWDTALKSCINKDDETRRRYVRLLRNDYNVEGKRCENYEQSDNCSSDSV